nr:transposase [Acuticoccus kalidii]
MPAAVGGPPVLRAPRHHAEKKTGHAAEQDRDDVKAERQAWFDGQDLFDPSRLLFVDETGTSTKMARLYGRSPRGERCRAAIPHGHWQTTTFIGALTLEGIVAPMTLPSAMNGGAFTANVWCPSFAKAMS